MGLGRWQLREDPRSIHPEHQVKTVKVEPASCLQPELALQSSLTSLPPFALILSSLLHPYLIIKQKIYNFSYWSFFFSGFFQLSSFSTVNKTKLKHKKSTQWLEWLKQQWYWQESKATKASRDWLKKHKNAATTLQNYFTVSHRILTQNFTSANIYSRNRGCAHKKSWWMFKKSWWMTKFSTIQVWVNKRMKF